MPLTPPASSPRQRAAPSTTGERESPTPSQLDILAERNERLATPSPFARAGFVLAIVAVILLLGALLWWFVQRGDPAAPGSAPRAVAPAAGDSRPLAAPTTTSDGPAPETPPASAAAQAAAPSAVPSAAPAQAQASVPAPTSAERVRKAQARRESDARAKASAPAPRQPREIDPARDPPAAAEARRGAGPAASGTEAAPRLAVEAAVPGVRELCASRNNIVSELFCRSRECRNPVHAKDATCVRLKEIEDAQRRVDQQ